MVVAKAPARRRQSIESPGLWFIFKGSCRKPQGIEGPGLWLWQRLPPETSEDRASTAAGHLPHFSQSESHSTGKVPKSGRHALGFVEFIATARISSPGQ